MGYHYFASLEYSLFRSADYLQTLCS